MYAGKMLVDLQFERQSSYDIDGPFSGFSFDKFEEWFDEQHILIGKEKGEMPVKRRSTSYVR